MIAYIEILIFLIFSTFLNKKLNNRLILFFVIGFFSLFIGLREHVGGDWTAYLRYYHLVHDARNLFDVLLESDPGYIIINYISSIFDGGIYMVNFISGLIFLSGLYFFIKEFKLRFSLSLVIAFPYLITIISMGYTRQSIALGILFFYFVYITRGEKYKALLTLFIAILFHKTAIFAFVFLLDSISLSLILLGLLIFIGLFIIFQPLIETMYRVYLLETMKSSGGFIRLLLLSISSLLFFLYRKKWYYYFKQDYKLIKYMSLYAILFLFLAIATSATTLFDRLSLYIYPLQLVVLNRILILEKNIYLKYIYFLGIIFTYSLLLIIWLNLASHRYAWIPYDNIIFRLF